MVIVEVMITTSPRPPGPNNWVVNKTVKKEKRADKSLVEKELMMFRSKAVNLVLLKLTI